MTANYIVTMRSENGREVSFTVVANGMVDAIDKAGELRCGLPAEPGEDVVSMEVHKVMTMNTTKLDPAVKRLFDFAEGLLDYLSDEKLDNVDQGIVLCFALVLHKRQHNPSLESEKFFKLIERNLQGGLQDVQQYGPEENSERA